MLGRIVMILAYAAAHTAALTTTLPAVSQISFSHECEIGASGCLGSPSIIRTTPTTLLATHDHYKLVPDGSPGTVFVWAHTANGEPHEPWINVANVSGIYWAELTAAPAGGAYYLLGTSTDLSGVANVVVSKCLDRPCTGAHWSTPSVILRAQGGKGLGWHSSGAGSVWAGGRIFRAIEALSGLSGCMRQRQGEDAAHYRTTRKIDLAPVLISAPESCAGNLTSDSCWTVSKPLCFNETWRLPGGVEPSGKYRPWEEATTVSTSSGEVKVIMRLDSDGLGRSCNGAMLLDCHQDNRTLTEPDAASVQEATTELRFSANMPSFPSGSSRFVVRRHGESDRYYSLTNPVDANRTNDGTVPNPCGQRNQLALAVSANLVDWKVCEIVLFDDTGLAHAKQLPDASFTLTGFQYAHWQFDDDDIIYVVRAAYRGATDRGQANRFWFGRLENFAQRCA